jgi:hypothetical protein
MVDWKMYVDTLERNTLAECEYGDGNGYGDGGYTNPRGDGNSSGEDYILLGMGFCGYVEFPGTSGDGGSGSKTDPERIGNGGSETEWR